MTLDLQKLVSTIRTSDLVRVEGRVQSVIGLSIKATIPGVRLHDLVQIIRKKSPPLLAEVVGFQSQSVTLFPLGNADDIGPDDIVHTVDKRLCITFGNSLLGRVIDGLGNPIDNGPELQGISWQVMRQVPNPYTRPRIDSLLPIGIRSIDGFTSIGEGQRVGLFSGSGVGKSTLLGQIARQSSADVFVVCLVGERGRELLDFIQDCLGEEGLKRGVVICATSDTPALVRMKCPFIATAIAEGFRDQGKRVIFLMDSITRFARAARDVGLASGENPVRRGYPPTVFAILPTLLERCGTSPKGSITAFYTVLLEGDDLDDPIADEVRGVLDGHIVLRRSIGHRGRWPSIDVLSSISRLMSKVADPDHLQAAQNLRKHLSVYESKKDLISLGTYKPGSDPSLDKALSKIDAIEKFLNQGTTEYSSIENTIEALKSI